MTDYGNAGYSRFNGSNRDLLIKTIHWATMQTIKVSTRQAYGQTYVDVIDDKQRGALQSLTGNSTLTQNNINSLKVLGFTFELVAEKPAISL